MTCIECGKPARFTRALDAYDSHCSNECAVASWERARRLGQVQVVDELRETTLDEALSTTGIPAREAS